MPLPLELAETYRTYYAFAQQAAQARTHEGQYAYTSAHLVSAVNEVLRSSGRAGSFQLNQQLTTLFGIARKADVANQALMQAPLGSPITADMSTNWPTAASTTTQQAQPEYYAKAQFTYTNALGEQSTGWISVTGITAVPQSKAALVNRLQGAAMVAYSTAPEEGGTPKTDAEVMMEFGDFLDMQFYAV